MKPHQKALIGDRKLSVCHDVVLVQLHAPPEKYRDTVVLPNGVSGSDIVLGTVLAYGPGKSTSTGARIPIGVKKSEVVAFDRWTVEMSEAKKVACSIGDGLALIKGSDILLVFPPGTSEINFT